MLLKVYKSRVWMLLFMLMPFMAFAQPPGWAPVENPTSAVYAITLTTSFDGVDAPSAIPIVCVIALLISSFVSIRRLSFGYACQIDSSPKDAL